MNINGDMFRAYDIRGIAGGDLTDDAAYLVGRAFATYLARERPPGPVVVGRDNRPSGDTLQPALVRGLLDSGRDVVDIGVVPTPVLYWALRKLPVVGGAQVTASHNPREYNGVKLSVDTDALDGERLQDLLAFVREDALVPPARPPAGRRAESLLDQYVRDIVARAGRPSCPLRVVMDCGNGTASVVAPALFRTLGVDHTPLFCESDGTFPNHPPDPSVAANLRALSETVRATGADLGVAFDGDADRIGVVDDRGDFVPGDRLLAIYAQEVLTRTGRGQPIVFDVKASRALSEAIRAAGGVPIMWKTGSALIKAKMRAVDAPLAGELSGHIYFAEGYYGFDDALYAAARLLRIVSGQPRPLSALLADMPTYVATPELRLPCPDDRKFAVVAAATAYFRTRYDVNDIDGVRVEYGDGWGLLRASNTQPALVLRFEALTQDRLDAIACEFDGWLRGEGLAGLPPDAAE